MLDTVICGDCLEELPAVPEDSIDAIVCDPPYELTSGKNSKKGFMGKTWDGTGIAYNVDMWAGCLRVLKPGGHLLAFGGTRTYHRMAGAIEDAGFECRDMLEWVYGSGFPKSLNIGKQLSQEDAKKWEGFGTALKPSHEPIGLFRKPLDQPTIAANVLRWGVGGINIDGCRIATAELTPRHNTGERKEKNVGKFGINDIDFVANPSALGRFPANLIWSHSPLCKRIGTKKVKVNDKEHDRHNDNRDSNCYGKYNPSVTKGFADADGMEEVESWDCAPDCPSWQFAKAGERPGSHNQKHITPANKNPNGIYHDCDLKLGAVTGYSDKGSPARFFKSLQFTEEDIPAFVYYAKAGRAEREKGLDGMPDRIRDGNNGIDRGIGICTGCGLTFNGSNDHSKCVGKRIDTPLHAAKNNHPTVKPLALMRYLCRLICPPNGTILDPFGGSGTTGLAAKQEGFHYILIEREPEYVEIARHRIASVPRKLTAYDRIPA